MTNVHAGLNTLTRTATALAALAAALIVAAPRAAHADSFAAPSVKVDYSDLNLASDQGSRALYSRIVYAARAVCVTGDGSIRNLHQYAIERSCVDAAVSNAVRDVHSPKLAAYVETRQGRI
jgi:UrcA family protein